jgi:hypothetical protein
MTVTISRPGNEGWMGMVAANLKSGNNVYLENFDYSTDLDKCHTLAIQFNAKVFIDAHWTVCHFLISN